LFFRRRGPYRQITKVSRRAAEKTKMAGGGRFYKYAIPTGFKAPLLIIKSEQEHSI
jgi:hypothetical protein